MTLPRMLRTPPRRIVVKVGTSVLTERGGDQLSPARVQVIAAQVARLHRARRQVIVVTSGAIAAGMRILGYRHRPTALARLQAASAIGQGRLMHLYELAFAGHGCHAAQLLLTRDDLHDGRGLNVKATLATLLAAGVIPVVNENDSVSTDEIRVGDNDQLAAHVAILARAQLLVLLSDVAGFFRNPRDPATLIKTIVLPDGRPAAEQRHAGASRKATSVGGMRTKLLAAALAMTHRIPTVIADGHVADVLRTIVLRGLNPGTCFVPAPSRRRREDAWTE